MSPMSVMLAMTCPLRFLDNHTRPALLHDASTRSCKVRPSHACSRRMTYQKCAVPCLGLLGCWGNCEAHAQSSRSPRDADRIGASSPALLLPRLVRELSDLRCSALPSLSKVRPGAACCSLSIVHIAPPTIRPHLLSRIRHIQGEAGCVSLRRHTLFSIDLSKRKPARDIVTVTVNCRWAAREHHHDPTPHASRSCCAAHQQPLRLRLRGASDAQA